MLERKELSLAITDVCLKASGEGYTFEGYASKFNGVDSYGDMIMPGAYKGALKACKDAGRNPKMFFNHRSYDLPVGKWTSLKEDTVGLVVAGTLTKGMSLVEDIKLAMANETMDGLSVGIGLKATDYNWVDDEDKELRDKGVYRVIKNVSLLREISLVTFPADDKGRVDMDSIKSELLEVASLADLEQFLREAGHFSKSAATAVVSRAKAIIHGDHGTVPEAKSVQDEVTAMLRASGLTNTFSSL